MSQAETGWIPVALARDVEPSSSMGTQIHGQEIVVWRDSAGQSHVWEDRCPHRGMRLSFGFVRGNHIACLYHGWEFDTAGQCRKIPAHPELEVPKAIKTVRYASAEAAGMVWVHEAPAEGALPPGLPAAEPVRSLYLDCPAARLVAALREGDGKVRVTGDEGQLLTLDFCGAKLLGGVQPLTEDQCALHLALPAPGADPQAIVDWSEALRRRLEVAPVPDTSAAALAEAVA